MKLQGLLIRNVKVVLSLALIVLSPMSNAQAENDHLDVRAQLTTSYDDNVTFAHTNQKRDFLESVLLGIDLKADSSRNRLLGQLDLTRNFYFDNSSFDNTAVGLRLRDDFEVSQRLRLNATDDFTSAEAPNSFDDEFGRTNGRYRTDKNELGLGADYDLSSHTLFQWTYGHEYTGYSRRDLSDTDMHRTGGRIQYAFDEANRIGAGYDYSHRFFATGNEIVDHTVYGDYGHNFTRQLSLNLKAGEDFIDSERTGNAQNVRYEASLTNDVNATTRGVLKYTRGLSSYANSENLFDSYRLSLTFGRELTQRMVVYGSGFYGVGEYQQTRIKDKLSGIGIGLNYSFSDEVSPGSIIAFQKQIQVRRRARISAI
jgi:hypothetical protein